VERQLLWCGAECDTEQEQEQGQVGLLTGEPLTITPVEGPISKGHRTDLIQNLPTHPFGDPVSSELDVMPFVCRLARRQSAACCVVLCVFVRPVHTGSLIAHIRFRVSVGLNREITVHRNADLR
jgi:hypothetical protein